MGKRLIGSVGLAPGTDEGTDLTTKGDIHGFSSSNTRIPIGDNDQILTADSSEALGLKWATASAGGGSFVRLDAQELGSDTGAITYTPDSALTEEKYAMVVVVIETEVTSAGVLQMEVNSQTSGYYTDGSKWNSGSATVIDASNEAKWDIMDSTSTGTNSHTVVMLSMGDASFTSERIRGTAQGSSQDLGYFVGLELDSAETTITQIEVSNNSGNLKAGTKMTTYGVERS